MAKITDFGCVDEHEKNIRCDAFGNNVAFSCPKCCHPILAIIRENQRGAKITNPAVCRYCHLKAWLSVDAAKGQLRLQQLPSA
jgi:hypothetical protein